MKMKKRIGFTLLFGGLILGFLMGEVAEAQRGKEEVVAVKSIVGKVVCFTPRGDPKFIGIAVDEENTDYFFCIDENIKIVNKKNLKEIAIGDTVEAKYHVIRIPPRSEEAQEKTKRVAKMIRFVKSGKKVEGVYNSEEIK